MACPGEENGSINKGVLDKRLSDFKSCLEFRTLLISLGKAVSLHTVLLYRNIALRTLLQLDLLLILLPGSAHICIQILSSFMGRMSVELSVAFALEHIFERLGVCKLIDHHIEVLLTDPGQLAFLLQCTDLQSGGNDGIIPCGLILVRIHTGLITIILESRLHLLALFDHVKLSTGLLLWLLQVGAAFVKVKQRLIVLFLHLSEGLLVLDTVHEVLEIRIIHVGFPVVCDLLFYGRFIEELPLLFLAESPVRKDRLALLLIEATQDRLCCRLRKVSFLRVKV